MCSLEILNDIELELGTCFDNVCLTHACPMNPAGSDGGIWLGLSPFMA